MSSIIEHSILTSTGLVAAGSSTRLGGVSPPPLGMNLSYRVGDDARNVNRNREIFFDALGMAGAPLAYPQQAHTATVRYALAAGGYPACDALVTDMSGLLLAVSVADCIPVLIVDVRRRMIAAVHAGWRGSAAGITRNAVALMVGEFRCHAGDMRASLGPGAGGCCYAVGPAVAAQFPSVHLRQAGDATLLDLKEVNRVQLLESGLAPEAVEVSPHCTICEADLFHSYRRDRERSGRMMAAIGLMSGR